MNNLWLVFVRWIWHETAVPIFIERFVLPLFATLVVLLAVTNPMQFDPTQRVTGTIAIIALAIFVAHSLHKSNRPKSVDDIQPAIGAPKPVEPDHRTNVLVALRCDNETSLGHGKVDITYNFLNKGNAPTRIGKLRLAFIEQKSVVSNFNVAEQAEVSFDAVDKNLADIGMPIMIKEDVGTCTIFEPDTFTLDGVDSRPHAIEISAGTGKEATLRFKVPMTDWNKFRAVVIGLGISFYDQENVMRRSSVVLVSYKSYPDGGWLIEHGTTSVLLKHP